MSDRRLEDYKKRLRDHRNAEQACDAIHTQRRELRMAYERDDTDLRAEMRAAENVRETARVALEAARQAFEHKELGEF